MAYELKRPGAETLLPLCCLLFALCMSVYIMLCFFFGSDFIGMGAYAPAALMEGKAPFPHAHRQLMPYLARLAFSMTPEAAMGDVVTTLHDAWWRSETFTALVHSRHPTQTPPELSDRFIYLFSLFVFFDYLFLLGFAWVMWLLGKALFPGNFRLHALGVALALLALPVFCARYGSPCDFPQLFFVALLTLLLAKGKPVQFCAVLALATLNKETSFYLIVVYALWGHSRTARQQWFFYLILQLIVYATVQLFLFTAIPNPPGSLVDWGGLALHIQLNWDGYTMPTLLTLVAFLLLFSYDWSNKPALLKCWAACVPVVSLGWLCFGTRNDYRMFYDVLPALCLMSAHSISAALQWHKDAKSS